MKPSGQATVTALAADSGVRGHGSKRRGGGSGGGRAGARGSEDTHQAVEDLSFARTCISIISSVIAAKAAIALVAAVGDTARAALAAVLLHRRKRQHRRRTRVYEDTVGGLLG